MKEQLAQKILSGEIPDTALTMKFKSTHENFKKAQARSIELMKELDQLRTQTTGYAAQCDVLIECIIDSGLTGE